MTLHFSLVLDYHHTYHNGLVWESCSNCLHIHELFNNIINTALELWTPHEIILNWHQELELWILILEIPSVTHCPSKCVVQISTLRIQYFSDLPLGSTKWFGKLKRVALFITFQHLFFLILAKTRTYRKKILAHKKTPLKFQEAFLFSLKIGKGCHFLLQPNHPLQGTA